MYAFGPLPRQKRSGRVIGTHQKIDRVARKQLNQLLSATDTFPLIKEILHFEGSRGPDAIKLKSPGVDEPWHFIDPAKPRGSLLIDIRNHQAILKAALTKNDMIRAGFEAAWLAHAVTDGLTPAHHEDFEEQLREIGHAKDAVASVKEKIILPGNNRREKLHNNWKYWGAKGIMTTHTLFEGGIAAASKPYMFNTASPSSSDLKLLTSEGFEALYLSYLSEINDLKMYHLFKKTGWTNQLALLTNKVLLPKIIIAVTLAWYDALPRDKEAK